MTEGNAGGKPETESALALLNEIPIEEKKADMILPVPIAGPALAELATPAVKPGEVTVQGPSRSTGEWRIVLNVGEGKTFVIVTPDHVTAAKIGDAIVKTIRAALGTAPGARA